MAKENSSKDRAPSSVFKVGAIALAFLIIGYQSALFVHRAASLRIASLRDHPDTVFVVDEALAARVLGLLPATLCGKWLRKTSRFALIPPATLRLRAPPVHVATGGHGLRSHLPHPLRRRQTMPQPKKPAAPGRKTAKICQNRWKRGQSGRKTAKICQVGGKTGQSGRQTAKICQLAGRGMGKW